MNPIVNRHADLGTTINRSLTDLDLLGAKRSELAHHAVSDPRGGG